jgi:hypothetical protein
MLRKNVESGFQLARLFAVVNVAMADACIYAWKEKYIHNLWRPVIAIREAALDPFPETVADPTWTPLGSPMTNTRRPPSTPPFPGYPSGHATVGTAALRAAEAVMQIPSSMQATVVSEEFNGVSTDSEGNVRPYHPRTLSIETALSENSKSREFLGVHFTMDCTQGVLAGADIGQKVAAAFPRAADA